MARRCTHTKREQRYDNIELLQKALVRRWRLFTIDSLARAGLRGAQQANQRPTSGSFVTYAAMSSQMPNARLLRDYTSDGVHTIGLVGSVGIEGFVAPKISIGAEVNLTLLYTWTPQQYGDFEGFNLLTSEVEHFTDLITPKSSQFVFGTQNIGANLFMNFYFNR